MADRRNLWKRRREETHYKCDDLVKAKDNPIVLDALKKLASNDEVRKGLIRDMNQHLRDAASNLDRVMDDRSSWSYVDEAINKLDRVKDLLGRLREGRGRRGQADLQPVAELRGQGQAVAVVPA